MAQPPPAKLSSLFVRREEVPEAVKPPAPPPPEGRVPMSYRPRQSVYDRLRELAYKRRRPAQALMDEAIEAWLEQQTD